MVGKQALEIEFLKGALSGLLNFRRPGFGTDAARAVVCYSVVSKTTAIDDQIS